MRILKLLVVCLSFAGSAFAQTTVTSADLRDRRETLRVTTPPQIVRALPMLSDEPVEKVITVPVGTEIDVRLQTPLGSATAKIEQRFEATTLVDVTMTGTVVIPAGTVTRGFVSSVRPAGRTERKGSITLSFDEMTVGDKHLPVRASVVQALDGKMGDDAGRKSLLAGILIGSGGTMAASDGANAELPVGTILRIRLDRLLEVTIVKR